MSVRLFVTGPDAGIPLAFVLDDVSVDFVPEPSTIYLLMSAAAIELVMQLRRTRR